MFSDAIIKNENNLVKLQGLRNDQKKAIDEIKELFMNEINKLYAEIDGLKAQTNKVLINHATIINNIKDAISVPMDTEETTKEEEGKGNK